MLFTLLSFHIASDKIVTVTLMDRDHSMKRLQNYTDHCADVKIHN